jgi:hypothetical protein
MIDAQLQDSENLVFEHSFFYRQADLDKLKQQNQQTAKQPADQNPVT